MLLSSFFLLLPALVFAAVDLKTPCHNGQCSYDIQNSTAHGVALGTLQVSGSASAISDLTTAAGWEILGCNPKATSQTIRAVCTGSDSACQHMYQNGAVGTIVRLPENCGPMPFARIVSETPDRDQTLPPAVAHKTRKRATPPVVRSITLDTQFHDVDPSRHGPVSMTIQGATGINSYSKLATPASRSLDDRSLFSAIGHALQALSFNVDKSQTKTVDVNQPFTLIDKTVHCPANGNIPAFDAGLKINGAASAKAQINYGLIAKGTLVPPKITDFGLFTDFDAQLDGQLEVNAIGSASISSPKIPVFSVGLPGLNFPGILTLGPAFEVNAMASAAVEGDADMTVDLAYTITGAKLYFPPNSGSSAGTFAPANTNLKLSANPTVVGSGNVQAHLIPTVLFGINALDGLAKANVNLNLDTFAQLDLSLAASAAAKQLSGCTDVKTGLSVNAGADGSFFSLFSKSTSVSLFNKTFTLFTKCFGNPHRREHARSIFTRPARRAIAPGLTCSAGGPAADKVSIMSGSIAASSIH